jgi:iron(III) transport system permease protein
MPVPEMATWRPDSQTWTLRALALLVAVLVAGPLLVLLRASVAPANSLPFDGWGMTLAHFAAIFTRADNLRLAGNTLLYALGSVGIGVALATAIAWTTERTDMPGRLAVRVLMFSWMAVPPLVMGFGWILLINPGNGALNALAKALLGTNAPLFTIYSLWSLILITALAVVPTAFVMVSGLMRNMDPQLEHAATVHGARGSTVLRQITLPLVAPGVLSVVIFMFMAVVQAFDLPLIIGLTARIPVLSTRIYLLSSPDAGMPNYGLSSAFGVLLMAVAALLLGGYFRAVRVGERFRVVTGRGFRPRRIALKFWRWPVCAAVMGYFVLMLMPLAMLGWTSLFPSYRLPAPGAFADATLANYVRVLEQAPVQRALGNTLMLVLASASIVMALSSLIAWFSVRGRSRLARVVDVLSFAPHRDPADRDGDGHPAAVPADTPARHTRHPGAGPRDRLHCVRHPHHGRGPDAAAQGTRRRCGHERRQLAYRHAPRDPATGLATAAQRLAVGGGAFGARPDHPAGVAEHRQPGGGDCAVADVGLPGPAGSGGGGDGAGRGTVGGGGAVASLCGEAGGGGGMNAIWVVWRATCLIAGGQRTRT